MILFNYTGQNILINRPHRIIIANGKNSLEYNSILLNELIKYISKKNYANIKISIEPQEVSQFENDFDTNSQNIQNMIYSGIINIISQVNEVSYSYYPAPESVPVSNNLSKIHNGWLNTSLIGEADKIPIGNENGYLDSSWIKSSTESEPHTIPISDGNGKIKNSWLNTNLVGSPEKIPLGTQDGKLDNSWLNLSLTGEQGKIPTGNENGKLDNSWLNVSVTSAGGKIPIGDLNGKIDTTWLDVSYQPLPNMIPIANEDGKINIGFIPPNKKYYARNQKTYQWPIADPGALYNVFNLSGVPTGLSSFSFTVNTLYLIPFYAEKNFSINSVYIISRGNVNASTTIQFAIYSSHNNNDIYYPSNRVVHTQTTFNSLSNNQTISLNIVPDFMFEYDNLYWLGLLTNRSISIGGFSALNAYINLGIFFTNTGVFRALHYAWLNSTSVMPATIDVSQINFSATGFQTISPAILYRTL
ncbi:MAG: hypothetical protein QXF12_05500 [Candidatus Aenigmatarchaeota archaeon]